MTLMAFLGVKNSQNCHFLSVLTVKIVILGGVPPLPLVENPDFSKKGDFSAGSNGTFRPKNPKNAGGI